MFDAEPFVTPYDLRFSLFGIRIRVQALFWLLALFLGVNFSSKPDAVAFLIAGVVFVSILIHELGHSLTMRYFGIESHIVLYWMGGLAIPGAPRENAWAPQAWRPARRSGQWDQVLILLAGPGAGFVFALLVAILLIVGGGSFGFRPAFPWFWEFTLPPAVARGNANLEQVVDAIFMFNFIWGLLNLVPVFPLDGGQISRELFVMSDPWRGFEKSLILSLSVALLMAVWAMMTRQQFTFFLFLSLAFSSYTALQQVRR